LYGTSHHHDQIDPAIAAFPAPLFPGSSLEPPLCSDLLTPTAVRVRIVLSVSSDYRSLAGQPIHDPRLSAPHWDRSRSSLSLPPSLRTFFCRQPAFVVSSLRFCLLSNHFPALLSLFLFRFLYSSFLFVHVIYCVTPTYPLLHPPFVKVPRSSLPSLERDPSLTTHRLKYTRSFPLPSFPSITLSTLVFLPPP